MKERILFLRAMEIPSPEERKAFLEQACEGDAGLMARVLSLIEASSRIGTFLASDEAADPTGETVAGETGDWKAAASSSDLSFLNSSESPNAIGTLGHYEIREVIGQGAFGVVLGGWDKKLAREVAIKVLLPHLAKTSPPRKRFLREARSGAAIRHPNVIQVFSVEEEPIPYIVMERVQGQTLQECIDNEGPLESSQILPIALQLSQALAASHATGLVHRDVKPTNILIETGRELRVVLTDFGLARTMDDASLTQSGFVAGTPMYMSPEQTQGHNLDARSDQFSLGSVLYLMITGRPPFRASSALGVMRRVAEAQPRPISEINPDAPKWLCDLIERMMHKNPEDRFPSLDLIAKELKRIQTDWIEHGRPPQNSSLYSKQKDAPKRSTLAPWKIGLAAAAIVLAIGAIFASTTQWKEPVRTEGDGEVQTPSVATPPDVPRKRTVPSILEQAKGQFAKSWPDDAPPPAVVPFDSQQAAQLQQQWAEYMKVPVEYTDPLGMTFRLIPPGIFLMGSPAREIDRAMMFAQQEPFWTECVRSEGPQHWVMITRPYYVSTTEVTQSMYEDIMSINPSRFRTGGERERLLPSQDTRQFPVEGVSWTQAAEFCRRANLLLRLPVRDLNVERVPAAEGWPGSYGLLTEAQWEFACRAGTETAFWTGDNEEIVPQNENISNTMIGTIAVASFRPNGFGLFDMHGNVEEHVYDIFSTDYYQETSADLTVDPCGPPKGTHEMRVIRGGDCDFWSSVGRSASRWADVQTSIPGFHTGLRLSLSPQAVKRMATYQERSSVRDAQVLLGADLQQFKNWLATIQPTHIPSCINIRTGQTPARFDAVALNNDAKTHWQVNFFDDAETAAQDFMTMQETHANHWRLAIPKSESADELPVGLVLWVQNNEMWETYNGDRDWILGMISQGSQEGFIPTSIESIHINGELHHGFSRLPRPGVGNHAHTSLSLSELKEVIVRYKDRQWRPHLLQLHAGSNEFLCAAVFRENHARWRWDASFDLTEAQLASEITQRRSEGLYPHSLGSYMVDGPGDSTESRYVVLWME
jgi:eukaryotic-like serine/threonine-protein kinase